MTGEDNVEPKIKSLLQDEKSRAVFESRKHFSENGDERVFADVFVNISELQNIVSIIGERKYAIYGAGFAGLQLFRYLQQIGVGANCCKVWDRDIYKHGLKLFGDISVSPLTSAENVDDIERIIIAVRNAEDADSIMKSFSEIGVPSNLIVSEKRFGYALSRCSFEDYEQYFDEEIIIPRIEGNEIFIDGGSCNFYTSGRLLEITQRKCKRIHAFEPDPGCMEWVKNNIKLSGASDIATASEAGLWSSNGYVNFATGIYGSSRVNDCSDAKIAVQALDSVIGSDEKVTFIKMDIEGSELEALKGSAEIIRRDKPKLAISIYHKPHDYIEIPEYIHSLAPEYKMFMRHYTPLSEESVLYCVA